MTQTRAARYWDFASGFVYFLVSQHRARRGGESTLSASVFHGRKIVIIGIHFLGSLFLHERVGGVSNGLKSM